MFVLKAVAEATFSVAKVVVSFVAVAILAGLVIFMIEALMGSLR